MQMFQDINRDGKDLQLIKNMYRQKTAAIKIKSISNGYQKIEKGVRQGCVLSPELFSLYNEIILRTIKDKPGIRIGGASIDNLRYADDIVLIAGREEELQDLVHTISEESGNM